MNNKPERKKRVVNFYTNKQNYEKIKKQAEKENRTISNMLDYIVMNYVQKTNGEIGRAS